MNIIAVVVTFNRLELLKRNISCLRQNKPVSKIIVVNNGSTDGTGQWLAEQNDLVVVTQSNVGGSGGFYTGIRRACELKADWIWCMDDDVFPRPDCMEHLLPYTENPEVGMLAPRRLMEGKIYTNDFQALNLTNPFASLYHGKLSKMEVSAPVEICGTAFEGPFIRREVVDKIGLPNKDLFIFCDDTDYCIRTVQAGYKIMYIPDALMDKQKFFSNDSWAERNKKKKWKRFYQVRNSTYLNHHYGKNWAVRYLRGFNGVIGYILIAFFTFLFSDAYQWRDISKFWKVYLDGLNERLGKME
ncbi:glycosyltransferase family 2 protein [uncultured Bacteroides sp.]|uniref:glycosyltransferase family 2 protein n=1 Tax=uncultured Bacteroides sp. TaxID=162156 RepID=UPI0026052838|nr:glycosyltransferase family 2 protein [uncultured Bacteroides sp.]